MARSDAEIEAKLLATVRRSRRRLWRSRMGEGVLQALMVWIFGMLLFGALRGGGPVAPGEWIAAGIGLGLLAIMVAGIGMLRGTSLPAVAARMDRALGFFDRVSSALEFLKQPRRSPFMQAHVEETAVFLEAHASACLPAQPGNTPRVFAVFVALLLVALLPHADRQSVETRDGRDREQARRERGQELLADLKNLRQEAEVRNLRRLADIIAEAERTVRRHLELAPREEPAPVLPEPPSEDGNRGTSRQDTGEPARNDPAALARSGEPRDGLRVASRATYQAVGKFDAFPEEAYAEVFAELDGVVLDAPLDAREMQNLAEHVDSVAGKINNYAFINDAESCGAEGARRGPRSGSRPDNSFEQALAPLQYKAFSEFLKRYAAHLSDKATGKAHWEAGSKAADSREVFNVAAPPPKDGRFSLQGVTDQRPDMPILQPSEQAMRELAARLPSQPGSGPQKGGQRGGTEVGGSGAGSGASDHSMAAPAILPRAEGGEYLRLQGRLGEGESVIQLIQDRGRHNLAASRTGSGVGFDDVFREYAHSAEADLNGEGVPWYMREFIRDYFRSIRPGAEESPAKP